MIECLLPEHSGGSPSVWGLSWSILGSCILVKQKLEGEAFCLSVDLHSNAHPCSWALGSDQKNMSGSASEIGWGARHLEGAQSRAAASLRWKEPAEVVRGSWLGCLLGASLWMFSWHGQLGGDPWADPEPAGGIIYLIWPGNASGSPRRSWEVLRGRRASRITFWARCQCDPTHEKQAKMDGWLE